MDSGLKIDLIDPKVIERLGLKEELREEPIRTTIVDGLLITYGQKGIYLRTKEQRVVVEGRLFLMYFNITKLGNDEMILGIL